MIIFPVTCVDVDIDMAGSEATFPLNFSTLLLNFLIKRLGISAIGLMVGKMLGGYLFESVSTIWCSSLLKNARAIVSV